MSYTPTNWQTDDTVTAALLNKMENGIAEIPDDAISINLTYDTAAHKWFTEDEPEFPENVKVYLICDAFAFEAHVFGVQSSTSLLITTNIDLNNLVELTYPITYQLRKNPDTGAYFLETVSDLNPFIIELTPTSADLSGVMDKTPEEIDDAIKNKRRIIFTIPTVGGWVEASQFIYNSNTYLYSAYANLTFDPGTGTALIQIRTNSAAQTYYTAIFPLTPAS